MEDLLTATHYLPIITTILAAFFSFEVLSRYRRKPQAWHLLWWGIGIVTYGIGTLIESAVAFSGWHVALFKSWYIFGALLGGAPLGIGTVYLLLPKRVGHICVSALLVVVSVTSLFVILSPIRYSFVDPHILNGVVLGWQKIRLVSPFINSFAFIFLVGGAIYSAVKYLRIPGSRNVAYGNVLIAVGGVLPGIGGAMSRMGHTEALYVGELFGVILIWLGYRRCQRGVVRPEPSAKTTASVSPAG